MKVLLTLFVLLFSIPAHSSDDLNGNKLVCSNERDATIYLTAFEFKKNFAVIQYQATNKNPLSKRRVEYETTPEEIRIAPNEYYKYFINRKNLSVTRNRSEVNFQYKNGECHLYEESILDFISKKLEKYKEGNLLWEHS